MDCPGKIVKNILRFRNGEFQRKELDALFSPFALGFYTTLVCECAHASLAGGRELKEGVVIGTSIDAKDYLKGCIGKDAERYY